LYFYIPKHGSFNLALLSSSLTDDPRKKYTTTRFDSEKICRGKSICKNLNEV